MNNSRKMSGIILSVVIAFGLLELVYSSLYSQTDHWQLLSDGTGPDSRAGMAFAFDSTSNQVIMYGGSCSGHACGDTWKYTNTSGWQQINVSGPSPREDVVMTYDSKRDRMILLGGHQWAGSNLNDTWQFKDNVWIQIPITNTPGARSNQAMVYDSQRDKVVMFGGWSPTNGSYWGDTWEFDGVDWLQVHTTSSPTSRAGTRMVYAPELGGIILFGGKETANSVNDTWRYDGENWSQLSPSSLPPTRYYHHLSYDPVRQVVILFGGLGYDGSLSPRGDTWEFDGVNWQEISSTTIPPVTWNAGISYFPPTGKTILFGGNSPNQGNLMQTTWAYQSSSPTPSSDQWLSVSTLNAPSGRRGYSTIWTGSEMLVWGGETAAGGSATTDPGGRYEPANDSWQPISTVNAPSARRYHTAIWTGTEMIIWGGESGNSGPTFNNGGRYNPTTDSWSSISTNNAPTGRLFHSAVWTGKEMIIWGGDLVSPDVVNTNTGAKYDPTTDTWTPMTTNGAPSARNQHDAIWSGNEMIIWGGIDNCCATNSNTPSGGRYDPETDTWRPMSASNPSLGFYGNVTVWTGSEMLVWGGHAKFNAQSFIGQRYNPTADTWATISDDNAPSPRRFSTDIWTGREMLLWGGYDDTTWLNTGAHYDPVTDIWSTIPITGAPSRRSTQSVWTGTEMIVWGGFFYDGTSYFYNNGGRYIPPFEQPIPTPTATSTSTPTSTPTDTFTPKPPTATDLPTNVIPKPDLTISSMNIQLATGGSCNFTSTQLGIRLLVANIGNANAGVFVVEVNGVRQTVNEGLAQGATKELWFAGHSGSNNAIVDVTGLIAESNENNNFLTQSPPIPTLPPTCTPTATASHTPTKTVTLSRTPTPTPTFTITKTNTKTPTKNITPTFTATPNGQGDPYENDDSCSLARAIPTDGSIQEHSFHQNADEDWVSFEVVAGESYRVEGRVPPLSPVDLVLEPHHSCTGSAEPAQNYTFSLDVVLDWKADATGTVYMKIFNDRVSQFGAQAIYHLSVRHLERYKAGALIIIAGRKSENDSLQSNIHFLSNRVYQLWHSRGYAADRIRYLATDLSLDADGDGTDDVYNLPSKANVQSSIVEWAKAMLKADEPLTIYMVDHGDYDKLYLDGPRNQLLTPADLDQWLDQLEAAIPGIKINVIIEACRSGSFIDLQQSISSPNRVIISSTSAQQDAYVSARGAFFSDKLLDSLAQGRTLQAAFEEAKWYAQVQRKEQTAWIDDNGDGQPNGVSDGRIAIARGFGLPDRLGDNESPPFQWEPFVSQTEIRNGNSRSSSRQEIWAEVRDDKAVQSVFAVIYPPSYQPPDSTDELLAAPPPLSLQDRGTGWFAATYGEFDEIGVYRILVYAEDVDGLRSRLVETKVTVGNRVYLPLVTR